VFSPEQYRTQLQYRVLLQMTKQYLQCDYKAAITTAIRLRFGFDSTTTKNEHVHFFVASRGVVANKKAVDGAYNDVLVYSAVIRMAFTLTVEHRVASFDS